MKIFNWMGERLVEGKRLVEVRFDLGFFFFVKSRGSVLFDRCVLVWSSFYKGLGREGLDIFFK